jgi:rhodanese-related sulfurtransferase
MQGALLVDVREPDEYEESHIAGSLLVPLSEVSERSLEWSKDQEIILYCRSGSRSSHAMQWLKQQGFLNVKNLDGGIINWVHAKLPIETNL